MELDWSRLDKQKKYVMGVSGGPDSMALMDMLRQAGLNLVACLVNYHKRIDSDLDYETVLAYCQQYHLPLAYHEVFSYERGNFQAQARKIRYDFYLATAKKYDCVGVILAHHRDDFLETVLMQQARGMQDILWGIAAYSNYQGLPVFRPAMHCTKQELTDYCLQHQIAYRIDSSNLTSDYTRNYYRNEVLSHYSEAQKMQLLQQAEKANQQWLQARQADLVWLAAHMHQGRLACQPLLTHRRKEALLRCFLEQQSELDQRHLSRALIQECLRQLASPLPNVTIHLPVNFALIKEYDNMYVTKLEEKTGYCFTIEAPTIADYGYFRTAASGSDRSGIAVQAEDFPLTIRTRQNGDSILLSYGQKKLSRLFIDAKIPQSQRDLWPVVLNCRQEIILVPEVAKNKYYLLAKPTWFVIQ